MRLPCLAAGIALVAASTLAAAQVYSWKDPVGGGTRVSSFPPPWYEPSGPVSGPRVVVTRGQALVDDTSLPLEERSRLARRAAPPLEPPRLEPPAKPAPPPLPALRGVGEPDDPDVRRLPIKPAEE